MDDGYHSIGEVLPDLDPSRLEYDDSRRLLSACQQHSAIEVVELRRCKSNSGGGQGLRVVDGIVVECCDGTVPSRNPVGIKNRERLLLLNDPGLATPHDTRALRVNFPITPHQNHVVPGEPVSLCLYFEPWSAVERTWTAAKYLQRILWWLRETSREKLHRSDQPIERLYFVSHYKIVLPAEFNERAGKLGEVLQFAYARSRPSGALLRGRFVSQNASTTDGDDCGVDSLVLHVPPLVVTRIERYPSTLGVLHDQLAAGGSGLIASLVDMVKQVASHIGLPIKSPNVQHTLLLLKIPVCRADGAPPERTDVIGFVVQDTNLAGLGIACGAAFDGKDNKAYANISPNIGATGTNLPLTEAWRDLAVEPVDVRVAFTLKDARKASGLQEDGAEFQGVLAGLGALGSCLADLWCRTGWGHWSYVDDDILHAHNLVRHIAKDFHLGWAKVDAVADMARLTWPTARKPIAISAKVTEFGHDEVKKAIANARLLVDATTTLEVPRVLSDRDDSPRMVSIFLTPSGRDSVLLLEDSARKIRLHTIEAQYYRAILNTCWGGSHLNGHHGSYWVGGGCRDLSGVLSQEVVQLHGSTLARQVRLLTAKPEAQIRVWSLNDGTGAVTCEVVPVAEPTEVTRGEWRVVWDEGLTDKLRGLRAKSLPHETGGVILGYMDQRMKAIYIVDVLPAPTDSDASQVEFTRGAAGVREAMEQAATLTANIVGYLGEWHSHPRHSSAAPSTKDDDLLACLANTLSMDGVPALMLIVGETDISISIEEGSPS